MLSCHPIFTECWDNKETFPYEAIRLEDLPEKIELPLLSKKEQFTLTWYGKVNSKYKRRWGRQHHGIDIHLHTGNNVYAAFDGIVRYAQYNKSGFGNCVVIRHLNGLETIYAHLSRIQASLNSFVKSGDIIGLGGNTGRSQGPHLHFEVRYKDFSIDPEWLIDLPGQKLKVDTLRMNRNNLLAERYPGSTLTNIKTDNNPITSTNQETDSLRMMHPEAGQEIPAIPTAQSAVKTEPPPLKKAPAVRKSKPSSYTIRKGDNLTLIAKKTGISLRSLKKLNPNISDKKLQPGKTIKLR
jgi:murein DD-endopeptidase MepM/ murein hydrolase activator NlpD